MLAGVGLGKERGLGEPVCAGSPRIGPLGGPERLWTLRITRPSGKH